MTFTIGGKNMKTNYTIKDLEKMSVKELRRTLGRMNTEARKRASRLKEKGYSGAMTEPSLMAVKGLKKTELQSAILDKAQSYLRNPRSTVKGMRGFESEIIGKLKKNFGVDIKRSELDDFVQYIDVVKEVWGSLRYPSKYAVQVYNELAEQGIAGDEIEKNFRDWLKSESKMLDVKAELKKVRAEQRKGKTGRISADELRKRLEKKGK